MSVCTYLQKGTSAHVLKITLRPLTIEARKRINNKFLQKHNLYLAFHITIYFTSSYCQYTFIRYIFAITYGIIPVLNFFEDISYLKCI